MSLTRIEEKIEIEFKKIEEEQILLSSLVKVFNSYKSNLKFIHHADEKSRENTLESILKNKKSLEEHLESIKNKPEEFPRVHFPSLVNTTEAVLNHAENTLAGKTKLSLDDPMINEIHKISQKEAPIKIGKLIDASHFDKKSNGNNSKSKLLADSDLTRDELLHRVTEACLVQVVKDFLEEGSDPKIVANQAAISGHLGLFYLLHDMNCNFIHYHKSDRDWNLFHVAVSAGHSNIIKFLLDANPKGKIINLIDRENGCTPLHYAVENTHEEVVKLLIRHGADINQPNKIGKTPLQLALQFYKRYKLSDNSYKYLNIIRLLLEANAITSEEDSENPLINILKSALAVRNNIFLKIEELDIKPEEKHSIKRLKEKIENQYQTVNAETFSNIGLNLIDEPLLKAISQCPAIVIQALINAGVNFNLEDDKNNTPIKLAIELGLWDIVVHVLIALPDDKILNEVNRHLLLKHQEKLATYFIAFIDSLKLKDKVFYLQQMLGSKEGLKKSKPGNALGGILYATPSAFTLFLFGREKYRGEKVSHAIYRVVSTFGNLLSE